MSLSSIRSRVEAATPGPWVADAGDPTDVVVWGPPEPGWLKPSWIANIGNWSRQLPAPAPDDTDRDRQAFEVVDRRDAAFIAHARQDIPALLRVAEAAAGLMDILSFLSSPKPDEYRALAAALAEMEALP